MKESIQEKENTKKKKENEAKGEIKDGGGDGSVIGSCPAKWQGCDRPPTRRISEACQAWQFSARR
jgi:hypothetical protein